MGNEILKPSVSLSLVSADTDVSNAPQKVLLVGIMSAGASATSGALVENIPNDGSEAGLFGASSQLANAVRVFKSIAPGVQLDAIPLVENAGGSTATWTITVTGTSTEAGTIKIIAGSKKLWTCEAAVASGASASTIASAISAAINTLGSTVNCPIAASPSSGVVNLTYQHKGTFGNFLPVGVDMFGKYAGSIGGVTIVVAKVNGATNPTGLATSAIFDVVGNRRYQGIVWPDAAQFAVPTAWLDARFNANNRVLDGVAFAHLTDTYANCLDAADALNSKSGVLFLDKLITGDNSYVGCAGQEDGYIVATSFAAVRALRLTEGASINQYLTTKVSGDQFGGPALASLPYFNTTIPTLSVPRTGKGFSDTEIGFLEASGGSIIGQNVTHTNVLVGAVSTTYKTDPAGNIDPSWKYLNYVDTMSNVREYFHNNYKKRFGQSRLTEGTVQRGRDMVNKALFEAYTDQLYGDLSGPDFVLVQSGEVALNFFKKNRVVTLDLETGTINVAMLVPIVTQVRTIIGTIKIAFSTEG